MFDPQKLTHKSQATIQAALVKANDSKHPSVEPIHLLFALNSTDGVAREILAKLASQPDQMNQFIQNQLEDLPTVSDASEPKLSSSLASLLNQAAKMAKDQGDDYLSQEILLLAAAKDDSISSILQRSGISISDIAKEVGQMRADQTVDSQSSDSNYNVLEKYTQNLTQRARDNQLDPVIGRDNEIRRVMQVLSRRTKNNPVLVGDPGVGKTAIVEGLAQRIISGDVPESLKAKQVLVLDMASVLAGAKFRGEFEDRLKAILKELTSQSDRFIVFIDELHTIVGAGASEGAVDASNMLKPGLARGELHIIGATTINEYRKYIEKDSALERRFQPVSVGEPSLEDSIAILRGLKEKYEVHHGIGISDDAILAAVNLSSRYIADRFLPDKAIDLLDEAASSIKIQSQSKPETLDNLSRQITKLEIEKKALSGEKSTDAKGKVKDIDKQLSDLKEDAKKLEARWQTQKDQLSEITKLREDIDQLKVKLTEAERQIQLDEAAKIKYGQLPDKQKQLKALEAKWSDLPSEDKLIKDLVSEDDIAVVVSRWTGVPVSKLLHTEAQKLGDLEEELGQRVIGQPDALKAVSNAIRRSRSGLSEEGKPTAVFLFLGPTGVGKTETAKALAAALFNDEKALIRLDMSEYSERHSIARLIGSPPGYVGHEEGGQLTEAVRRRPYSIILFDEIEKAHDQVFNILLQIFDDGRLTDGKGRTVDFKNAILIMTSNLGSTLISDHAGGLDQVQDQIWNTLKAKFPPEFLNRIDQTIIFEKLDSNQIKAIVNLELAKVARRLEDKDIKLKVSEGAKSYLATEGYDDQYGARPLRRLIQNQITDEIALRLTKGDINAGATVTVDSKDGKSLSFS